MSDNTASYDYNFITPYLDNEFDNELEDLEKVYIEYVENEKEYIKFIKDNELNRHRKFQGPLSLNNSYLKELPIITNIPKSNIKQILFYKNPNKNPIIENMNIKSIYLTRLSFFGIVFAVNLMYYLIYYDYLNLKRLTYKRIYK
tara:strand:- start:738 stop:1169 length:432 start_codon:yes stop_codon:yes gene_type:complete